MGRDPLEVLPLVELGYYLCLHALRAWPGQYPRRHQGMGVFLRDDSLWEQPLQPALLALVRIRRRRGEPQQSGSRAAVPNAEQQAAIAGSGRVVRLVKHNERAVGCRVEELQEPRVALLEGPARGLQGAQHHVVIRFDVDRPEVPGGA